MTNVDCVFTVSYEPVSLLVRRGKSESVVRVRVSKVCYLKFVWNYFLKQLNNLINRS